MPFLALIGTFCLIDICGALDSDDGQATSTTFKDWLGTNVIRFNLNVHEIYALRCSVLHQGSTVPHNRTYAGPRVAATFEGPQNDGVTTFDGGEVVSWLSIPMFVDEVTTAAENWFSANGTSDRVTSNLANFARIRPEGLGTGPKSYPFPVIY